MFDDFSKRNRKRSESLDGFNHSLNSWTLSDWCTAVCGELGEAANVIKKLKRISDGIPGNKEHETKEFLESELADELADTYMYLDLLAQAANIDLKQAVLSKFNRVSKKLGYVEEFNLINQLQEDIDNGYKGYLQVHNVLNDLLYIDKDIDEFNKILESAILSDLSYDMLIRVLTITLPFKKALNSRNRFYDEAVSRIRNDHSILNVNMNDYIRFALGGLN